MYTHTTLFTVPPLPGTSWPPVPPPPGTSWPPPWYSHSLGSTYTTPSSATLYGSGSYQAPFMPTPSSYGTQQSPYIPPLPITPEFGESTDPQRPGASEDNDELNPSLGSRYPANISSPVVAKLSPPAKSGLNPEPVPSKVQAASNGASLCYVYILITFIICCAMQLPCGDTHLIFEQSADTEITFVGSRTQKPHIHDTYVYPFASWLPLTRSLKRRCRRFPPS